VNESSDLVLVELVVDQLVLALLLERDDDKSDEDVDEEERKDDEVDNVEDGHLHAVARLRTVVLYRCIHGVRQHAVCAYKQLPIKRKHFAQYFEPSNLATSTVAISVLFF